MYADDSYYPIASFFGGVEDGNALIVFEFLVSAYCSHLS
jgi:hypothetical protein